MEKPGEAPICAARYQPVSPPFSRARARSLALMASSLANSASWELTLMRRAEREARGEMRR